jgi:hypothetical protein
MKALFLTVAASALLVVPVAFSQTRPSTEERNNTNNTNEAARHEEMARHHSDMLGVIFNLTPEQKKETTTYLNDAWNSNQSVRMQMREDRKTLDKDIAAKADHSKLSADAMAIGHDRSTIVANNAYAQEKFFSMLSPAEQAKYEKLREMRNNFEWGPGHFAQEEAPLS